MKKFYNIAFLFLFIYASSQNTEVVDVTLYGNSITAKELKEHMYIYASDEFQGREAGTAGEILAINYLKNEYEKIGVKGGMHNGDYFMPMNVYAGRERRNIDSFNVLAFIKGDEKPDELLVITSHLDHVGVNKDGSVNNGADDDGSGTTAMLEMAEAFQLAVNDGLRPKRSVLFLHVSAEEKGLLGSEYYSKNPTYPMEDTVANLNIDMIGRIDDLHKDNPNYLYIIGSDKLSQDLHDVNQSMNDKYVNLELDYRYNDPTTLVFEMGRMRENNYYYRSDHLHFVNNNVPAIFYFNGTHEDYHRPTDTADKIRYDLLEKRARLIFYTAWEIVNREERLALK
jgi:Zn-dependent M28 family amino/carboxypeptidase